VRCACGAAGGSSCAGCVRAAALRRRRRAVPEPLRATFHAERPLRCLARAAGAMRAVLRGCCGLRTLCGHGAPRLCCGETRAGEGEGEGGRGGTPRGEREAVPWELEARRMRGQGSGGGGGCCGGGSGQRRPPPLPPLALQSARRLLLRGDAAVRAERLML
jgi:hypothetical protein